MKRVFKTKTFDRWARSWSRKRLENANSKKLNELVTTEILKEICDDKQKSD